MIPFSLLSAANCISAQSVASVNPPELKWKVNNTAMIDIYDGTQCAFFHWLLSFFSAPTTPDPITKLILHLCGPSSCSPGTWHGLDSRCNIASSVFLQGPLAPSDSPAWSVVHRQHQNGFWFWGYREKARLHGLSSLRLAFCRILSQWSSTGKHCLLQFEGPLSDGMTQYCPAPTGQNVSARICHVTWPALLNLVWNLSPLFVPPYIQIQPKA